MKKLIWALRVGIILFGAGLVWEQVQLNQQATAHPAINHQQSGRRGLPRTFKAGRQPQLGDFSAAKIEAAQVWLQTKGTRVVDEATPLHIRQLAAGQRIEPDDPQSAVYRQQMTQIYSDDQQDVHNRVTYRRNADNTVLVISGIGTPRAQDLVQGQSSAISHGETPVVKTINMTTKSSTTLLKVVQLII